MVGVLIAMAAFSISSPAFTEGGNIPSKYTCDAGQTNPSPALTWKDAPASTKSFVLIMHDPDAPLAGGFTHWVLFDIPATTMSLPENFQPGSVGTSGNSGFRRAGYGGPCPPSGSHHYHFMLSALDVPKLGVEAGATKADVEKAMQGHVIGTAETVGLYQRQAK
ncbi:MAG TPA: YbhB/YbcL family Raf kinase inhibitor-like protein [Vicinamibacterales bacterium]|nr:YbhB/YbcL family Raf kinase inhibitor-like protein [Vicinamibacterales bacterium]